MDVSPLALSITVYTKKRCSFQRNVVSEQPSFCHKN
jgi:hypothetical protein